MGFFNEYKKLYEKHIAENARLLIVKYNSRKHKYEYCPYSHSIGPNAMDKLSKLIIDNMVFYSFSEEEIVTQNNNLGLLDDLTIAAKYAYEQRLPKRKNADTDGTAGEVLLDIIIQVFEPMSQKLIARAKYKQLGDNNEIKGYDALYFTIINDEISLWLGQVKTGTSSYCRTSIVDDLNKKYVLDYFSKSVFYIADKAEVGSKKLLEMLSQINKICFESKKSNWTDDMKKAKLIQLLKEKKVTIKIPCLLAFTENIYTDEKVLSERIELCVQKIVDEFDRSDFKISDDFEYELRFCIFPLSDVKELRQKIIDFKKAGA